MNKIILGLLLLVGVPGDAVAKESEAFVNKVSEAHALTPTQTQALKVIITTEPSLTRNIGTEDLEAVQGTNNSWHPVSRAACIEKVIKTGIVQQNPEFEKICQRKWMSPVPGADGKISSAKVCIDQFEFPNIPCEYPVVWTPASSAKRICESMGKRVCNSHEWEGACAGSTDEKNPYRFDLADLKQRRSAYNNSRQVIWAFSHDPALAHIQDTRELCGVYSANDPDFADYLKNGKVNEYFNSIGKSNTCHKKPSDYATCGTNTWPAGFKHRCKSLYDVYDMHGNVAEVTNFPRSPGGLATVGNTDRTERKGSFFVTRVGGGMKYPDDCRVRQPYEHFNDYATDKHSYYQEGFRCCSDIK